MRGKKAKLLRRFFKVKEGEETRYVRDPKTGVIYATGERRSYQDRKRQLKRFERG